MCVSVHEAHIEAFRDENKTRIHGFIVLLPHGGDCLFTWVEVSDGGIDFPCPTPVGLL